MRGIIDAEDARCSIRLFYLIGITVPDGTTGVLISIKG